MDNLKELQKGFYWGKNIFGNTVPFSVVSGTYCQILSAGEITPLDISRIKDSCEGRKYSKEEIKSKSWYKYSNQGIMNSYTEIV